MKNIIIGGLALICIVLTGQTIYNQIYNDYMAGYERGYEARRVFESDSLSMRSAAPHSHSQTVPTSGQYIDHIELDQDENLLNHSEIK